MQEEFVVCPFCWQEISILIDSSISMQEYIEDCEVCCNPLQITAVFKDGENISLNITGIEQ